MESWALVVLSFVAVPIAAILGVTAIFGLGFWLLHKNRMARLEVEEKERQAELDRELLGLGSKDISANLQILLDRMSAVENRLDKIEAFDAIDAAKARGRIPISPSQDDEPEREQRRQTDLA